jgi:hypothetical protein
MDPTENMLASGQAEKSWKVVTVPNQTAKEATTEKATNQTKQQNQQTKPGIVT